MPRDFQTTLRESKEIRKLWDERLRDDVDLRAKVDTMSWTEMEWQDDMGAEALRVRLAYSLFLPVVVVFLMDTPLTINLPRLEWFTFGYWQCRLRGLRTLLKEDAICPGRFQARLELVWERFRGRAPPRHMYMRKAAEIHLNKKYLIGKRHIASDVRRVLGAEPNRKYFRLDLETNLPDEA